ncbi:uncharacterized protein LOC131146249 [Malania oleifera]|uniref:uncharacterized protein LOC131146249 n=1 Tax=Malania oleifera TaxID=397392 RepID=UPI0025ADF790|nr:uncharacterized protein LOC131146249 [Malania oleifera]
MRRHRGNKRSTFFFLSRWFSVQDRAAAANLPAPWPFESPSLSPTSTAPSTNIQSPSALHDSRPATSCSTLRLVHAQLQRAPATDHPAAMAATTKAQSSSRHQLPYARPPSPFAATINAASSHCRSPLLQPSAASHSNSQAGPELLLRQNTLPSDSF